MISPLIALIWEIFRAFEVRSWMLQHSTAGELAFSASTRLATVVTSCSEHSKAELVFVTQQPDTRGRPW